jgi:hypothetical protein
MAKKFYLHEFDLFTLLPTCSKNGVVIFMEKKYSVLLIIRGNGGKKW